MPFRCTDGSRASVPLTTAGQIYGCSPCWAGCAGQKVLEQEEMLGQSLCEKRADRVGKLLLLVHQTATPAARAAAELKPVGEGLKASRFADRQPAILLRVNQHALAIVANCYGSFVPLEPSVDVAVGP